MKTLVYWTRWILVFLLAPAVYFSFQMFGLLIVVPYVHESIVDDHASSYEISSHFLWDWIVQPFMFAAIGSSAASSALKVTVTVAPSFKAAATCIVAGVLFLFALGNLAQATSDVRTSSISRTMCAFGVNLAVAVVTVLCLLHLKSERRATHDDKIQQDAIKLVERLTATEPGDKSGNPPPGETR